MDGELHRYLDSYRAERKYLDEIEARLRARRNELFSELAAVQNIKTEQWGIIATLNHDGRADQLNVMFENGNCWFRNVDEMQVCHIKSLWPDWVRKRIAKYRREECRRRANKRAEIAT